MKPLVVPIDPLNIDPEKIKKAAAIIKRGGLVAFPTETVYGLGADALSAEAAAGIFIAKKRPLDDPLIVHISKKEDLGQVALDVPDKARLLIEKFWPGPLTVVLKKTTAVPDIVTTGLDTVAVRMPSGAIALKLIEFSGTPIAAPSANLFGKPSPTSAEHVLSDLGDGLEMLLDGGDTEIGIESTVVAFEGDEVMILRPGGTTLEDIEEVIGKVCTSPNLIGKDKSPGKYPQHYSPNALVVLVEKGPRQTETIIENAGDFKRKGNRVGIMCTKAKADLYEGYDVKVLGPENDQKTCAARLFRIFREFDKEKYDVIIAEGMEEKGLGLAVMNRIRKAAAIS